MSGETVLAFVSMLISELTQRFSPVFQLGGIFYALRLFQQMLCLITLGNEVQAQIVEGGKRRKFAIYGPSLGLSH